MIPDPPDPSNRPAARTGYLLAVDIGTTGAKVSLFRPDGGLAASASAPCPTRYPRPGWAEQDPQEWWSAACSAARRLLDARPGAARRIQAIGLCGMMNGCALFDSAGRAVRPALIHADLRGAPQCRRIAGALGEERFFALTANRLAPHLTLGKLAWLAEQEPASLRRARWCLQAKDVLAGRLTGVFGITDPSDASLTGLLDIRAGSWAEELVAAAGIQRRCNRWNRNPDV